MPHSLIDMKSYIIVAIISAVVSVFTWEVMHVVTGVDTNLQEQSSNKQLISKK